MKPALLTLALLLGVAPTAAAAPFGEVPFRAAGGTATCLRATGYPGELVRSTPTGAQFLQAGAGGLVPVADVTSGTRPSSCPVAVARSNGVGVVALIASGESQPGDVVRAALREPGGPWGALTDVATVSGFGDSEGIAADISDRGDALLAFVSTEARGRVSVRAARRAPGGTFGAIQTLFTAPKRAIGPTRVEGGISASGEAVVAWSSQPAAGKPREVWAAIAADGAPFGTPIKIGTMRAGIPFSLAVGAGGHALLAFPSGDDLLVAERAPGGSFGAASRVGAAGDRIAVFVTAAVRPDGGAIVAWQNALAGDLQAVIRAQPGAFGAPLTLAPKSGLRFPKSVLDFYDALADDTGTLSSSAASPDGAGGFPRALIAPDGRAFVTMESVARRDGLWFSPPLVAAVPLTGGTPERQILGAELREAGSTTPLLTAAGTVGIAWADNGDRDRDGRLHLALEGAADVADPAPPEVKVSAPERRVLRADEDLRFAIRCSAACDLRVQVGDGVLAETDTTSLTRAGEKQIRLSSSERPLATLRGGPVKIRLLYAAPGARRATSKTLTFQLRRLPDAPRPRVLDAVARRDGKAIVVTWRADRDAKRSNFVAFATENRSDSAFLYTGYGDVKGSGRRFSTRLENVGDARYVHILALAKGARKYDTTTVRVQG